MFHTTGDIPAAVIAEAIFAANRAASQELPMKIVRSVFIDLLRR
jgi:hypothetical protein